MDAKEFMPTKYSPSPAHHRWNPLGLLRALNVAPLILIFSLALLASCGGGGSDSKKEAPTGEEKMPTGEGEEMPTGEKEVPPTGEGSIRLHDNGNTKDITFYRADETKEKFITYQRDGVKKISETDYHLDGETPSRLIDYNGDGATKFQETTYEEDGNKAVETNYHPGNKKSSELQYRPGSNTQVIIAREYHSSTGNLKSSIAFSGFGTPLSLTMYREEDGTREELLNYHPFPSYEKMRTFYAADGTTATRIITYNQDGSVATDVTP